MKSRALWATEKFEFVQRKTEFYIHVCFFRLLLFSIAVVATAVAVFISLLFIRIFRNVHDERREGILELKAMVKIGRNLNNNDSIAMDIKRNSYRSSLFSAKRTEIRVFNFISLLFEALTKREKKNKQQTYLWHRFSFLHALTFALALFPSSFCSTLLRKMWVYVCFSRFCASMGECSLALFIRLKLSYPSVT